MYFDGGSCLKLVMLKLVMPKLSVASWITSCSLTDSTYKFRSLKNWDVLFPFAQGILQSSHVTSRKNVQRS